MLEGTVGLLAFPKLDEIPADRQPRRVKYMQEATVLALHAEALQPVAAHRLHSTEGSVSTCFCLSISGAFFPDNREASDRTHKQTAH